MDDEVASSSRRSSKSSKDSIPEMENLPAEAISHRERRRRLFAKGWGEVTSPAGSISHRDCGRRMSEGRETDDDEEEDEVEPRMEEQNKADPDVNVIQMDESSWMTVSEYRRQWNDLWSGYYGSSEDTSEFSIHNLIRPGFGSLLC